MLERENNRLLTSIAKHLDNWRTQIRKGYLDLCILLIIQSHGKVYGFELLEHLKNFDLPLKEGTLYPLLNRMTQDGLLQSIWETENVKGHPRKFYSLTKAGHTHVQDMTNEFVKMVSIFNQIKQQKTD